MGTRSWAGAILKHFILQKVIEFLLTFNLTGGRLKREYFA